MSSPIDLALLLVVMVLSHYQIFVTSLPLSNELSSTDAIHSAMSPFINACFIETASEEETECVTTDNTGFQLRVLSGQIKREIEEHSTIHPGAMFNCASQDLPILQATKVTFSTCDAANNEAAHKAIVSLLVVSHFLKNASTENVATKKHSSFYIKSSTNLQMMSCSMKCAEGGLDTAGLQTFVNKMIMGEGEALFEKENGFVFKRNVNETEFSTYQCLFLQRAYETLTNLIRHYENNCSAL